MTDLQAQLDAAMALCDELAGFLKARVAQVDALERQNAELRAELDVAHKLLKYQPLSERGQDDE